MVLGEKTCCKHTVTNSKFVDSIHDVIPRGTTIEKKLTLVKNIDNLSCNVPYELHALRHIRRFLKAEKPKLLSDSFIESQFNYKLLI